MNTKIDSSTPECSSILAVSSAGATVSSSTALLPPHLLPRQDYYCLEAPAGGAPHIAATSAAFHEEEDSSQSLSDSLECGVIGAKKRQQGYPSDFSDSIEDSGEDTDNTTIDSDTGSFYSIDSRLTPLGHESEVSLQDTEYFSESTIYDSAQSFHTPRPCSRSSYLSVTSNDTTDCEVDPCTANHQNSVTYQVISSERRRYNSDISLEYTSCPDLSPIGYHQKRGRDLLSRFSLIQSSSPVKYNKLYNHTGPRSSPLRKKTVSSSSMSAVEENAAPKVGEELETKKKKGLMSSFRKSRKTSRKLRQQKKAFDGDSTSTGTAVTSDGEQEVVLDSDTSAPNSPAPVKNSVREPKSKSVENAIEKPQEDNLDDNQAPHERFNGTATPKESPELNSNSSPPPDKKEKEEKKLSRSRFGSSIFRKKKGEQASTSPPTTDTNVDVVTSDTPENKEGEKEDEVKADSEPPAAEDAPPAQTVEPVAIEEPKLAEPKPSSFRSYISSVQFVKNWTVNSEAPDAQQTSDDATAKASLDPEVVEGEKAVDSVDGAPEGTATETKVTTSSANGKPSATEVTSKKKTTVTIITKQSPKLRTSPTNVVRRAKALASPPSPVSTPNVTFKAATVTTLPPNLSKRTKSPTPVLPKRLSLEIMSPTPQCIVTTPEGETKPQYHKQCTVTFSEGETKCPETVSVNETQASKRIAVNKNQKPKKITVNEPHQSKILPVNDPQQPRKVPVNQSQQDKKVPVNDPQQLKKVPVNNPQQPKKVLTNDSQTPKNMVDDSPQPKKILVSYTQQPKKVPVPISTTGMDEAAVAPTPVPFPVSTAPGAATPTSSPEGNPGRDARETPEGDRTENDRNSLVGSSNLTDSWAGASTDKREHLYKILVIGELGTGKTSIIKRYVHQFFSQHYRATIGVDFALKVLNWDNNTVIRLQLWDIAGQERFGNMTRVYYKEAVGAFVVFDVTRAQTFDAVTKWKTDLDTKVTLADGSPIPTVLLANKCDQPKEGVVNNPARMDDYCRERGFSGWFETSAKENINIDEASRFLVNKILINEKQGMMMTESMDTDKFSVDGKANPVDKSGCRC